MNRFARLLVGTAGLAIGVVSVVLLREATLSTHEPVEWGSRTEVILHARTRGGEHRQTEAETVEAVLLSCRLEVTSDLDGPVVPMENNRYRVVLVPALDPTNRRQFRGCVEDWTLDHIRLDVDKLTSSSP